MGKRAWWLLGRAVLGVAVFAAALSVFGGAARQSRFDPDENLYMWRGRYFGHLFLRHDLTHPEWADSYWTHTQPMLTNYLVGGWLWARGYDQSELPPPYDWGAGSKENRRQGRFPSPELLADARAPMVVVAAGVAGLLYLLGCALGSPLAGLIAAALATLSPLTQKFLVRALSEPPLGLFLLLALLVGVLGARRGRAGSLPLRWALALGLALGLGLATKLTLTLSFAAILAWGGLVALAAWRNRTVAGSGLTRAWAAGRGWALALALALGVFVVSNPHLYPNPLLHSGHLFQNRADEMQAQQRLLPKDALHNLNDRVRFVFGGSLIEHTASGPRRGGLEAALAGIGLGTLLARVWRGWRRRGHPPAEGLVLVTMLSYFVGVSLGLLLAWPHYLVPTFLLGTILSGLGAAAIVSQLARAGVRLDRRIVRPTIGQRLRTRERNAVAREPAS